MAAVAGASGGARRSRARHARRPPWRRRPRGRPRRRSPQCAPRHATPRRRYETMARAASRAPRAAPPRRWRAPRWPEPQARSPPAWRPVYRRPQRRSSGDRPARRAGFPLFAKALRGGQRQLVEPVALDHLAAHSLHGAVHGLVDLEDPAGLPPLLRYARGDLDVLHVERRRDPQVLVFRLDAERENSDPVHMAPPPQEV